MFYVVCFDIVEDRARYRVAKILKNYGERVQKSVFECAGLTEEQFLRMKDRLEGAIDSTEDKVRYYRMCKACVGAVEYSGIGLAPVVGPYRIV